ncbi:hypothetical protein HYALB_00010947 [Hymenoscyphus albidus]|uniref:Uncharacterized protein n=1 Tax=Hymenoscyphus albidus TaxID=595503 RepID=A0A9N9Q291_9HELO|nr:hypothetical protein HYALB_00010947 [Hymenoscyphus albidus]
MSWPQRQSQGLPAPRRTQDWAAMSIQIRPTGVPAAECGAEPLGWTATFSRIGADPRDLRTSHVKATAMRKLKSIPN